MKISKKTLFITLAGALLFGFRFLMGLSKFTSGDSLQIYLIGLKSYTSGIFPYFGPDVVYTHSQIPGALQGLLISVPLQLLSIPEAPHLLLNIMTFTLLVFFGWYTTKRIPNVPKWFIYLWLLTSPWTLHYSTHIENPSYVIVGSILFFVSFFELGGLYKNKILSDKFTFFFLGFSIFWIMQLHLSWVIMIPYVLWVIFINRKDWKLLLKGAIFFLIGSAVSISTLIPTLLRGFGSGGVESNIIFNYDNIFQIPTMISRYFMFSSFEIARFIGHSSKTRLEFLGDQPWVIPFVIFLLLIGFLQVGYFIFSFFRKNNLPEWSKIAKLCILSIVLLSVSFLFSITKPRSHTFFIIYPIAMMYAFYCYGNLFKWKPRIISRIAMVALGAGVLFHISLFIGRFPERSLFSVRQQIAKAINEKDYTFLALRRESTLMKTNKETLWQKQESDSAGTSSFYNNFEPNTPYFRAQNVVSNEKFEGNYACKVDSLQSVSLKFSKALQELENPKKIKTSFSVKSNNLEDFDIVFQTNSKSQITHITKKLISLAPNSEGWNVIQVEFNIPQDSNAVSNVHMHFTMNNETGSVLYIDNWELNFK